MRTMSVSRASMATAWILCAVLTPSAAAEEVVSLIGDEDNFGFLGVIADGQLFFDDLGGSVFTDNREIEESSAPANMTDHWEITPTLLATQWVHEYPLGFAPISSTLRLHVAGLADIDSVDLLVDGIKLATLSFPGEPQTTHVLDVPVPTGFIDGITQFQFVPNGADGFILDFAKLTVLPEPASATLLGAGLLMALRRRTRQRTGT